MEEYINPAYDARDNRRKREPPFSIHRAASHRWLFPQAERWSGFGWSLGLQSA
jgi:hypothetical protein